MSATNGEGLFTSSYHIIASSSSSSEEEEEDPGLFLCGPLSIPHFPSFLPEEHETLATHHRCPSPPTRPKLLSNISAIIALPWGNLELLGPFESKEASYISGLAQFGATRSFFIVMI
ncbi:hypothetical protein CRG98_038048 [Punica granatum]|uniref:Uncharacterized protein n=1 Tax=Punica granatum TaxID=22663 RepID=A0A2I0IC19_PUNGR|nr:hypothetical protein CRG98_038048 [Punica granatum]